MRLKRVDYVEQINASVYDRMKSERARVANELRSTGSAESEKIRADADRQRTVILAEAYRDAEKHPGRRRREGVADLRRGVRARTPSSSSSTVASKPTGNSFRNRSDVMVLDPNSEFFRYFRSADGATAKK